jgi:hypothetical protein
MPPLTFVPNLNVVKDGQSSEDSRLEGVVSIFAFQGSPEALFHSIIEAAPNTTHTDLHLSLLQQR